MNENWNLVKLSEIACPVLRPVDVEAGVLYRTIGVKWWGEGAYERETIDGGQTAAKTLFIVHEGDLIINKIWVRNGSIAIATKAVDGCAASGEFPTFDLDVSKVMPRWLHWLSKTKLFWEKCDRLSQGTSGKNRIKPELFLTITMPLPSLEEQQQIVRRIDELAVKIEEAKNLQNQVLRDSENLCRSLIFNQNNFQTVPIKKLLSLRPTDTKVKQDETYHFAGVYSFGRGVFKGQKKGGSDFAYSYLTKLNAGNFTYPKLMAWEGALGVVPEECDGLYVSPEFPVFEIDEEQILPEVIDVYFRTPSVWEKISGNSAGTNLRRRRLNPTQFLEIQFPLPPMEIQQTLREVKNRTETVKRLQAETRADLNALLPAVLDRAFKGKL